jgi:hypothetical protein
MHLGRWAIRRCIALCECNAPVWRPLFKQLLSEVNLHAQVQRTLEVRRTIHKHY